MKRQAATIALGALIALVLGAGVGLAQLPEPEACSLVGTWTARLPTGGSYTAVFNRGSSVMVGQVDVGLVVWDPTLASRFPAARTTDPKGVWEKVDSTTFNLTWVAYGLAANGAPLYVLRGRGVATMQGCDQATLAVTTDLFLPPQDIWKDQPLVSLGPDTAAAARMPVVPVTVPPAPAGRK